MESNVILYLERGAAVILNIEIWKRFIKERDERFKRHNPDLIQAIEIVQALIKDDGVSFTFHLELENQLQRLPQTKKKPKHRQNGRRAD